MSQTSARAVETSWPAPAKLNLFLHVTGRRPDGYHELQTLFQFIDVCDSLSFTPRDDGQCLRLEGPGDIPAEQDLVVRAAKLLRRVSGCALGADIRLVKRIPVGAGLGGGSSDAATTLLALNRLWNLNLASAELAEYGRALGADVPVFIHGLASWAEGIGERLQPVDLDEPWYLVITPPVLVSTREIFTAPELRRDHPPVTWSDYLDGHTGNDCEPVTRRRHPQVAEALDWLRRQGPASMSGTGASVFMAAASEADARSLQLRVPPQWQAFVARGLNRSPLVDILREL